MVESESRRPAATLTVGVLTPHVTPGPETEIPLMSAGEVDTVVSRIPLPEIGNAGSARQQLVAGMRPDVLDRAAAAFSVGSVDALAYASTSSGYAAGVEAELSLVERLQDRWAVPVVSSSLATVRAVRAYGLERVVLVHPPWFETRPASWAPPTSVARVSMPGRYARTRCRTTRLRCRLPTSSTRSSVT